MKFNFIKSPKFYSIASFLVTGIIFFICIAIPVARKQTDNMFEEQDCYHNSSCDLAKTQMKNKLDNNVFNYIGWIFLCAILFTLGMVFKAVGEQ